MDLRRSSQEEKQRRVAENKLQRRKKKRLETQETIGKPDFIEIKGVTLWMVSVFYLFSSIPPLLLHTNHNLYMWIVWNINKPATSKLTMENVPWDADVKAL
ncbi:hypothetical protein Bca4012_036003 [Brassica carinata]